jgi:AbrB family looped-hinge helix DNA binding protein
MIFTTATKKGQIVIPAGIRANLGIKEGSKLSVEMKKDSVILKLVSKDYFDKLAGVLKTKGRLTRKLGRQSTPGKGKKK